MTVARNSWMLWAISVLVMVCLPTFAAEAKYGGGSGQLDDPYLIYTAEHMNAIGAEPNDWDKHFRLMADIDLSGLTSEDARVIGNLDIPFTGTFDGNAHTLSHFACNRPYVDNLGLFGYVLGLDAEIKNLGLIDPSVCATMADQSSPPPGVRMTVGVLAGTGNHVGSLVGHLYEGVVTGCYVRGGSVSGSQMVGGLVGRNHGTVTNSYATCRVTGTSRVGGFVGANNPCGRGNTFCSPGRVFACYATGLVTGKDSVGGFAGTSQSGIRYCFWDVQTSGQATSFYGTGKTTAEMGDSATFVAEGWDFFGPADGPSDVWAMAPDEAYPILWWQAPKAQWPALPTFSAGTGTPDDPYLISSAEQLNSIGHNPRLMDSCFRLTCDIDLSQTEYRPIGNDDTPFAGVFDGNNKALLGFTCIRAEEYCLGAFGCVQGRAALIRDLALIAPRVEVTKGYDAGALIGRLSHGTIVNCFVEGGTVSGEFEVGGLVGCAMYGDIKDCYSTSLVLSYYCAGGLIGYNWAAAITRCHADGNVPNSAPSGGLVGLNFSGVITDCYAAGDVPGGHAGGGLVGDNSGTLLNCYATGNITGNQGVGGLVGTNTGTLTGCHATGDVSGDSWIGGLVGDNRWTGVITNCYATGKVRSDGENGTAGGLVGLLNGDLSHCYAVGRVKGTRYVGGLVGGGARHDQACFWNIETSGQSTSLGGTGKTTAEMRNSDTFIAAGWDFIGETANGGDGIWWIAEGQGYPKLWWQRQNQ